jgi:hypothetical protein
VYATVNGLSAALAALMGGAAAHIFDQFQLNLFFTQLIGLKVIYFLSWVLRFLAIPLLLHVEEPKGLPFMKAVQVLRSIRSMNTINGFHPLLHFFVSSGRKSKAALENRRVLV